MKRHLKSWNEALNVPRRHESVATYTISSDTPAVDSGVKQLRFKNTYQFFWICAAMHV